MIPDPKTFARLIRSTRSISRTRSAVTKAQQNYIRLRDGGICVYCKDAVGQEIDHVIPYSHGGPNSKSNLVLACRSCNSRKKSNFDIGFLSIAFKYLMDIGETLDWIDEIFAETPVEPQITLCQICQKTSDGYQFCVDCDKKTWND